MAFQDAASGRPKLPCSGRWGCAGDDLLLASFTAVSTQPREPVRALGGFIEVLACSVLGIARTARYYEARFAHAERGKRKRVSLFFPLSCTVGRTCPSNIHNQPPTQAPSFCTSHFQLTFNTTNHRFLCSEFCRTLPPWHPQFFGLIIPRAFLLPLHITDSSRPPWFRLKALYFACRYLPSLNFPLPKVLSGDHADLWGVLG